MNSKTKKFIKNLGFATAGAITGGIAGAELSDLLTDSEALISTGSTIGQYALSFGVFLPLHAQDNQDLYKEEKTSRFKWKEFGKDIGKLTVGFGVLDYFYLIGRPAVNYYFQKEGYSPEISSLISDSICIPLYCIIAIPMAKELGIMREGKDSNHIT